jgi:hypothetical protein
VPLTPVKAGRRDLTVEVALLALAAVYIFSYVVGRLRNRGLVDSFLETCRPVLAEQFVRVPSESGGDDALTRDSANEYKVWVTGRRNCLGMQANFTLVPRQELLTFVAGMFMGAAVGPNVDTVTFEVRGGTCSLSSSGSCRVRVRDVAHVGASRFCAPRSLLRVGCSGLT